MVRYFQGISITLFLKNKQIVEENLHYTLRKKFPYSELFSQNAEIYGPE